MTRTSGILLGIVGALLGVLGTLGVQHFAGDGDSGGTVYLEDIDGYEDASTGAGYYCTLGGVVPG